MSTALLPAAGTPAPGRHLRTGAAGALDVVHDHVLRLVGDPAIAASVTADVALRITARATSGDAATDLEAMLRAAHARIASVPSRPPSQELVGRLAEGPAGRALVLAMAAADRHGAAVLELTARHGLRLREAAAVVGLDHATAARARTDALGAVRVDLAGAGASVDVDVPTALAQLPVIPAPEPVQDLLEAPAAATPRHPVHPVLAWVATAVVALATVGGLVVGLPALAEADASDAPVVRAVAVEAGPAADELATPDGDDDGADVERLVVRTQESAADETATPDDAPTAEVAPTAAPSPAPTAEPTAAPDDAASPAEEPTEEPGEDPSEGPLGELLPGP